MLGEYSMSSLIALIYVKFAILIVPAMAVGFSLWRKERRRMRMQREDEIPSRPVGLPRAA